MKKYLVGALGVLMILFVASCGGGDNGGSNAGGLKQAEGGRYYGGVFRMNEVEYYRSLYPLNVTEVTSHRITNQIYEGLVHFNQADLTIVPALAESWEVDSNATIFTFKIRKGVHYHDDPCFEGGKGREVTANDFKYCFTKLCESDVNNQGSWVFEGKVKGCEEYLASTMNGSPLPEGVTGVQVIDDYTLRIELVKPFAGFLNLLALPFTAVFPEEAVNKYGVDMRQKTVGTGPFFIKAQQDDNNVILSRNPNYWGKDEFGNQLPYMDGMKITFIKDRKTELLEFTQGNLDMMYRLPLEMTEDVVSKEDELTDKYAKYTLQVMPSLAVQYYGFQHKSDLFSNMDVRKAFNYAIDRKKIVEYTLKGAGTPGNHGIVPPGAAGYDAKSIQGYEHDPAKAREHLEKAGYKNGEGFPQITLQINSGGGTNEQVAEAVQKMLKEVLNVDVTITAMPFAQHLENLETGKALFWRSGWIADYPDPENFLNLFWSVHIPPKLEDKSYLNSTRYTSPEFDAIFEEALRTVDAEERNALYLKAEQIMMDDAAIIPIYYYRDHRLLQPDVKNFPQNAMEYRNFRDVYFVPTEG